jgi:catechol 2,3-dioxygenase-like lactoylglutathione lyase family enzyme
MKRVASFLLISLVPLLAFAQEKTRPRITGISMVMLGSQNQQNSEEFYRTLAKALLPQGLNPCDGCRPLPVETYFPIGNDQLKGEPTKNLLEFIGLETDDARALRQWLQMRNCPVGKLHHVMKFFSFTVSDPEGHQLHFVQEENKAKSEPDSTSDQPQGIRLIHAGWVVKDRAAEDKFYKDILGFHVYWHGGRKDDETNWVDMQVPDGTDWIEYMLNVPADANKHTLGVMNHIAIGVSDIHVTQKKLLDAGVKLTEQPKIGRDGKWQLNLYDPDETRVEFMEFTPTQKPCCSEYTGPHPKP